MENQSFTPEFLDRPVYSLSVRELLHLNQLTAKVTLPEPAKGDNIEIRGIHGLAKFLGVSPVTAQKIKNSGNIPFSQFGRVILFDGTKVLEAMANNPKRK